MSQAPPLVLMSTKSTTSTSLQPSAARAGKGALSKRRRPPPMLLTHERDFFRQMARLESMESYVLVSTLTSSMSFGCLLAFDPLSNSALSAQIFYRSLCMAIQVVAGFSTLCGLYATIMFSLTILYGKSALGTERDREYDKFLRRTVRARVSGSRMFSFSLALFALEALLVLVERTCAHTACSVTVGCAGAVILYCLYRDWRSIFRSKEVI